MRTASEHRVNTYSNDLESPLSEEVVRVACSTKRPTVICKVEVENYRIVMDPAIKETIPNVEVALRLNLTPFVSNCSRERSFHTLKRVKNEIRTNLRDEQLRSVSIHIHG